MARPKAKTIIYGPDGDRVEIGQELPDHWPDDFIQSLQESGGATKPRAADDVKDAEKALKGVQKGKK